MKDEWLRRLVVFKLPPINTVGAFFLQFDLSLYSISTHRKFCLWKAHCSVILVLCGLFREESSAYTDISRHDLP